LKKVVLNGDFSEELLTEFVLKFGQSLEFIQFISIRRDKSQLKTLLPFVKNLKTISLSTNEIKSTFDSFLPKLEEIIDLCVYELNDFIVFTDKYCKQIKKINFRFIRSRVSFTQLLRQLSRYQNIEALDLTGIKINEVINKELLILAIIARN
jgi:hypothetical protein